MSVAASPRLRGVLAPVLTPFDASLAPDAGRLIAHCRWLLQSGAGLAPFGTNSEANSLSLAERMGLLDALLEAGIDPGRMIPGTGCCAFPDTVALTGRAVKAGCAGVLMLPPFYYKGNSDDGLFRSFAEVIERVGDARLRIYLYHIPPVSGVPLSLALIERLIKAYPGTVAGIKDSSGDWKNTEALLHDFQSENFDVFPGSESFLLAALRLGGAGCISATANVNPAPIADLYRNWQSPDAEARQAALTTTRKAFEQLPMIVSMKAAIARTKNDPAWAMTRPPFTSAPTEKVDALMGDLAKLGFSMPGI